MTGSLTQRILFACGVRTGLTQPEVCEATAGKRTTVCAMIGMMINDGRLHKAGVRCRFRYFARAADRDAYAIAHADEIAAELALTPEQRRERNERRKSQKQSARRAAERRAAGKSATRQPKMSDEERRQRKAEQRKRHYEKQRSKLGLTVKQRKPTGSPDIPTTPKKSKQGEPGRGRGIVIGKPKAFTVVTAQDKAKPTTKHSGEPVETPNTIYTRCPPFVDRRYQPDPSIAGRGAITEMWLESRRLQEQTCGEADQPCSP